MYKSYYPFVSVVLLIAAILCFLLAVFHASVSVDLTNLGLAFFAGSFLFPRVA